MHNENFKRQGHHGSLRNACRAAIILLFCTVAHAIEQPGYPNSLSVDSVDPKADSLFFASLRARMDSIRLTQGRPTVALVLSGGGAKGAAEVGAIKFIEELGIPIDFICGASIGGMIGAAYSIGYRGEDLEYLFRNQNWEVMLSDFVQPKYIPYSKKMYNSKFLLNFHFDTAREVFYESQEEDQEYRKNSLSNFLPSGFESGFNVNNFISRLTVGLHDSLSFAKLPIAFSCVAVDMVSGKIKNWSSGSLHTAMRSTMSIPGLFSPVRSEGMVLVDGGIINNFPADLARAAGADYIVGIDLSGSRPSYEEVKSILDILRQFSDMPGRVVFQKNLEIPDIIIKPELEEFNMMSFNKEAVDTMLVRGYAAALDKKEELLALKETLGLEARSEAGSSVKPADTYVRPEEISARLAETSVRIDSVVFTGVSEKEASLLLKLRKFPLGEAVSYEDIESFVSKIQGSGAFSSVSWFLYGESEPYLMHVQLSKAPSHSIGLSARIDTEEWTSILLNLGLNINSMSGSRFNFCTKLGQNLKAGMEYSLDFANMPSLNLSADVSRYDNGHYWSHKESIYFSGLDHSAFKLTAGFMNRYIKLDDDARFASVILRKYSEDALEGNYIGAFGKVHLYTFDNYYYPSKGINFSLGAEYDFLKFGTPDFSPTLVLQTGLKTVLPFKEKFAIIPKLDLRAVMNPIEGDSESVVIRSPLHANIVGGAMAGRYTEGQVSFFGLNYVSVEDEFMCAATLELRYSPIKRFYISTMAGFVESNTLLPEFFKEFSPKLWAVGAELAYDFFAGPIKINCHWSNLYKLGFYASIGFDF